MGLTVLMVLDWLVDIMLQHWQVSFTFHLMVQWTLRCMITMKERHLTFITNSPFLIVFHKIIEYLFTFKCTRQQLCAFVLYIKIKVTLELMTLLLKQIYIFTCMYVNIINKKNSLQNMLFCKVLKKVVEIKET